MLSACASYKFAADGVKADKVDQYVNIQENIRVWLYLDYDNDLVRNGGISVDRWYDDDRHVLKKIGLSKRSSKVLFSVKSTRSPLHHLVAVKQHKVKLDTSRYNYVFHNDSYYYQRDFELDDIQVRHAIIPYDSTYALSLVYYSNKENNSSNPFHKLDYLARINAYYLQHPDQQQSHWQVNECASGKRVDYILPLDQDVLRRHRLSSISLTADDAVNPSLTYFKVLKSEETMLSLKLCPTTYLVKYMTIEGDLLKTDTVMVGK